MVLVCILQTKPTIKSKKLMSHLVFHFYISVSPHVDPWNDRDVQIDICAVDCITLESIHTEILKVLDLQKSLKLYYRKRDDTVLDLNCTLKELGINANCTIFLDRLSSKRPRESITPNPTISIFIITRIGSKDGSTSRRIKIICRELDDFGDIMDELSDTLEKTGLKFKLGRTILKSGKTLQEQNISDGCEITVVGGRG